MRKRIAVGISVGLNLLVVAAVLWLSTGGFAAVARDNFVKPMYARWVSQFDQLPVEPGETVFLGDSLIEFGNWSDLFPAADIRNRGIAGDDTAGVLGRLDEVVAGRPSQVFLMIGTNDLSYGIEEAEIVTNVETIVSRIRRQSPDTEVFVHSLLPRGGDYQERVESLNHALQNAVAPHAIWIDLYKPFLDDDGSISDRYSNDELHLFGEGYLLWRDLIEAHVNTRP